MPHDAEPWQVTTSRPCEPRPAAPAGTTAANPEFRIARNAAWLAFKGPAQNRRNQSAILRWNGAVAAAAAATADNPKFRLACIQQFRATPLDYECHTSWNVAGATVPSPQPLRPLLDNPKFRFESDATSPATQHIMQIARCRAPTHFKIAGSTPRQPLQPPHDKPNFRIARDAAWLRDTAARVAAVLQKTLPPLASHPRPAVRAAVARGFAFSCFLITCGSRKFLRAARVAATGKHPGPPVRAAVAEDAVCSSIYQTPKYSLLAMLRLRGGGAAEDDATAGGPSPPCRARGCRGRCANVKRTAIPN